MRGGWGEFDSRSQSFLRYFGSSYSGRVMEYEQELLNAVRDGLRDGIKRKLSENYNNPLDKILLSVLAQHRVDFEGLLGEAIESCVHDEAFREEIKSGARQTIAKVLVKRFGGELEKQVNALKSDPVTRARIVTAIDEIVKSQSKKTA